MDIMAEVYGVSEDNLHEYMKRFEGLIKNHELRKEYDMFMSERMRISGIMYKAVENANLQTAKKMLSKGFSISDISDITDLPIETIREIKPDN